MSKCFFCDKDTYNPKFCSSSCAAKYNNKICPKRKPEGKCSICNKPLSKLIKNCPDCRGLPEQVSLAPINTENQKCLGCDIVLSHENSYRAKNRYNSYCKLCIKKHDKGKRSSFKRDCIKYKGGKCEKCGYSKNLAALQFHHLDPSKKEFGITKSSKEKLTNEVILELDKCILVCSNCHFEIHNQDLIN